MLFLEIQVASATVSNVFDRVSIVFFFAVVPLLAASNHLEPESSQSK
jgi:hypothetical protein